MIFARKISTIREQHTDLALSNPTLGNLIILRRIFIICSLRIAARHFLYYYQAYNIFYNVINFHFLFTLKLLYTFISLDRNISYMFCLDF